MSALQQEPRIDERRRRLVLAMVAATASSGRLRAGPIAASATEPTPPPSAIPHVPDSGPKSTVVRNTRHRMLFYQPQYGFRGPTEGLQDAEAKVTPILYIPPSQHTVETAQGNVFDHSETGIEAGAERACRFILNRAPAHDLNLGLMDLEMYPSVNLPPELGYDPDRDGATVVRYLPLLDNEGFRLAAVRFHRLMAAAMFRRLRIERPKFELGWYNIPRTIGWYDQEPERVAVQVDRTYQEAYLAALEPFAAFTGPGSQMILPSSAIRRFERGELSQDAFIDWKVNSCRVFRERLGPRVNIVTTIWPRWFILGSPKPGPEYPGGDAVVPPGFMTQLCTRLLDEGGVSGFFCWRASTDDDHETADPRFARRMSDRWAEVAAVINQHTDFRAIDFSRS